MTILEFVTIVSGGASIVGGVDVVRKHFTNSTPEDLFKKSFIDAVKQIAQSLDDVADPKTIKVNQNTLNEVLASLKDIDLNELATQEEEEKLAEATALFRDCIDLPGHQLRNEDLLQRLQPIIKRTFTNFYDRLPRIQQAANQLMLKYDSRQLEGQKHLIDQNQAIQGSIQELDTKITDLPSKYFDLSVSAAVQAALEKEHQLVINKAKDLLKKYKPKTSLDLLEDLRQRKWINASDNLKFNILTNMAAAYFEFNNEQEAARLLIEASQYHSEDEKALSNRALAHLLLREMENAADYAEQTLKMNPKNTDAYVILVGISTEEETLEEVIAKIPVDLHDNPQIAYAISDIAKQRRNFEEAKKWGEIMVAHNQGDVPDIKAAFATILINHVLEDSLAVGARQLTDPQKQQLRRAIELLTEAWDSISKTELKEYRANWIINRGTAHFHLGETEEATADLDTALGIEKSNAILIKNRTLLAFDCGEKENAIEFLEKIQYSPEVPEAPIILANILFACKRYDEAITTLTDFIKTDPSPELQNDANCFLVRNYIAAERFDEAERILTPMLELSPTNVLNLTNAALISSKTGKRDEAILQFKEAYKYAQDSENFLEIAELADQLYIHDQFKEAATLYEKLADTSQNSQLTQWLVQSYYNSGEIGKALEICQKLREKYGPLENISRLEFVIYEEIGDLKNAIEVAIEYEKAYPTKMNMQIDLAYVYYRLNKLDAFKRLLEKSYDLKQLSMQYCFNLANLYRIGSKPEIALDIMYETRRTHYKNADAHLKYIGLFNQNRNQMTNMSKPDHVELDTAVEIDTSSQSICYVIVNRDDVDITRGERDINDTFTKHLLGKKVGDEVNLGKTPIGQRVGKITDIKSKYIHACQETFQNFSILFPDNEGLWSVTLEEFSDYLADNVPRRLIQRIYSRY